MNTRRVSRVGVVRDITGGCATIEVGVPCGGCSQVGCGSRRMAGRIQLATTGLLPGDRVRLSLASRGLTFASLALFGPPLVWLALTGFLVADLSGSWPADHPLGPVLFGCGMVSALGLGGWLGRRATRTLAVDQARVVPGELGSENSQLEPLYKRADLVR